MPAKGKNNRTMPEKTAKKPFIPDMRSKMDAEGMYTGTPGQECFGLIPVQDADDL